MRLSQADPILTLLALMTDNGLDSPDLITLQPSHYYMLQILLLHSSLTVLRHRHTSPSPILTL